MRLVLCVVSCLLLFYTIDSFALTPAVDLSGKWSGTVQMQDTYGYCTFVGSVTATLQQDGNSLSGNYVFTMTSARPTGKLEGLETCSLENYSGTVRGTIDGTRVSLADSEGLGFSGSATSDMLTLSFGDEYITGTAKLQKFADFSKPTLKPKSEQTVDEMVQTGLSYLNEKRFDKALENFNKIIGKDPNNILGWMGKGVSYVGLKNYDQAITHFKKSLEISPNNKDALQWLARTYYLKNDCQSASDYSSQALSIDPQNSKFLAEKKIIDSCLAKQTTIKPKSEAKPETRTKLETKEIVKSDYPTIKSTLDKINDPGEKARKALEILSKLPAGPISDDLQVLLSGQIYDKTWRTSKNKELLIDRLPGKTPDGALDFIKPTGKTFNNKEVYFINGVNNSPQDSNDNAQALADMLERPVKRIYNKTDRMWADLIESGELKLGMLKDNPAVQSLVENIMADLKRGETVEIHAHSEGALMTSVALGIIQENDPDFFAKNANKVSVNTYGGAAWTYPSGPKYDHATFMTDLVGWVPGRTILAENLLLKTNPEKLLVDGNLGLPGHAFTGYVQDKPRFLINKHTSFFILDAESLGKDMANYNPKMVSGVLADVGLNREEEVTYQYVKNLDDVRLKSLPKDLLNALQKNLKFGTIKNSDDIQLVRINKILETVK